MTRAELEELIDKTIAHEMQRIYVRSPHPDRVVEARQAILSAIEQSGCTICPNEPTEEMVKAASSELNGWDRRFDGASTISWNAYIAMLSSSPFKRSDS